MTRFRSVAILKLAILFVSYSGAMMASAQDEIPNKSSAAQDIDVNQEIARATAFMSQQQKFLLQYKLKPNEELVYKVEDTFTQKTSMSNVSDSLSSRTQSVKKYVVKNVDSLKNMTFIQILQKTKSWTQLNEKKPVEFDSESKSTPPAEYIKIANMIGVPQLTYTMAPNGKISEKRAHFSDWNLGTGGAFIALPDQPISVGYKWYAPRDAKVKHNDGRYERIRLRNVFKLVKVINGQAWNQLQNEVLTPMTPKIKSQILQQLTSGFRVFDIEKGHFVKTEIEWNETVQGFQGSDSIIEYFGKYSEAIEYDVETAVSTVSTAARQASKAIELRTLNGRMIMRK